MNAPQHSHAELAVRRDGAHPLHRNRLMTLQEFIKTNHEALLALTRKKVTKRKAGTRSDGLEAKHGVHVFLTQLRGALDDEAKRDPAQQAQADPPTNPDIARTAASHGHDLLTLGFSVGEVVHDYGDVCQAVTELAVEQNVGICVAEFHTMNRCLDNAIAAAVSAWSEDREADLAKAAPSKPAIDKKLRRLVAGSLAIFEMLRSGRIGSGGAAADMLGRHLAEMRDLLAVSAQTDVAA